MTHRQLLVFVGPAAAFIFALYLFPLLLSVVLSLFDWTAFRATLEWIAWTTTRT